jgi:hypothetical protein
MTGVTREVCHGPDMAAPTSKHLWTQRIRILRRPMLGRRVGLSADGECVPDMSQLAQALRRDGL